MAWLGKEVFNQSCLKNTTEKTLLEMCYTPNGELGEFFKIVVRNKRTRKKSTTDDESYLLR